MGQLQVFISYAWGGESEQVADEIETIFKSYQIKLIRDKNELGFKGLIRDFMRQIGKGDFVILIISDKYLKSKNCMFELMEVAKREAFLDRIFPIVLPDAAIYDGLGILSYLKYWDKKLMDLNASAKELESLEKISTIQNEINLFAEIRATIDDLAGKLSNMNTLTLEIMRNKSYQPLIEALKSSVSEKPNSPTPTSGRKEGNILYHIPNMMQVLSWTRCTVRLAWDEILLNEGLTIPEEDKVIESIRLGEIMQVSLKEGQSGANFEIKALNNEEQFILSDDFTEWLFDVRPLETGDFILILRVTLIQLILGKERKKDIVLERSVKTTAANVPKALAKFETAKSKLIPPTSSSEGSRTEKPKTSQEKISYALPKTIPALEASRDHSSSPRSSVPPPATGKSIFRKIVPYAASLAGIILIAFIFFPSSDYFSSDSEVYSEEGFEAPNEIETSESLLISMSRESIIPNGEVVKETSFFKVSPETLENLWNSDLGDFTLTLYSDSIFTSTVTNKELFNYIEIVDSLIKINTNPLVYKNKLYQRKDLRVIPKDKNQTVSGNNADHSNLLNKNITPEGVKNIQENN